jgi:hypothetical protein
MNRRRVSLLALLFSLVAAAVLGALRGSVAGAATPPSGMIGPTPGSSVSWTGQSYLTGHAIADPTLCPPPDPGNTACDHFSLTVNVAPSYWDTHTGGADIEIHWTSTDDDFDLYVYDSSGNEAGRSAAGGTTSERVFIQNAAGTYEVRIVPFLITSVPSAKADGSATFVSQLGGPTPNPTRGTGGLAFGPATVVDAQRTEGEPVNHIDKDGHHWETGPWGFSTGQMFVHRSVDSGDQFNIVSPNGLRPNPSAAGGGDSDIATDDQGFAYFADLEGLAEIGCGVSNDNGNTWLENNDCVPTAPLDDRQWLAVDNGDTSGTVDNTVFLAFNDVALGSLIYSTPGSTGSGDLMGGVIYQNSSADPINPVQTGAPCGQLRFDPANRYLYYPCANGDHIQITRGHVNVGQRNAITYTNVQTPASPGGQVGDIFPNLAIDKAGNIYAVWIDEIDHNVYYAFSTNQGTSWSSVRQINGNDANSNVFPWAVAGNTGKLAVVWYGNSSHLDSDNMPSWYNNRQAAAQFKWFGYASLVTGANTAFPSYAQTKFTEKPMHYGQICNGGLGCTTSMGDRTMADFFAVALDLDGSMRIVYNDTTSQHHGAHLFEERQLAGPSAFIGTISKATPKSPMTDPAGDAHSPHYFPVTGAGPNQDALDFVTTSTSLPALRLSQQPTSTGPTLRVEMRLQNLAAVTTTGKANDLWLTRFQALSVGDQGEESYRIFYVGAERPTGTPPTSITFFAGSGTSAQPPAVPGNGCVTTTPQNCKVVQYPNEVVVTTTGSVSGNVITIDVPIQGGFGANRPIFGDTLFNVTALSAGRNNATTDVYADVDATRAFDFKLGGTIIPPPPPPPPPTKGCKVTGGGAVAQPGGEGKFTINAHESLQGKVDYRDPNDNFRSTRLTSVTCNTTAHSAEVKGTGTNNGHAVDFTVDVIDNGEPGTTDAFQIDLSDGGGGGGTLIRGNIQVHD